MIVNKYECVILNLLFDIFDELLDRADYVYIIYYVKIFRFFGFNGSEKHVFRAFISMIFLVGFKL